MTTHPPKIGDIAPEFEALTDSDEMLKLSDYRGQRVILYFYPKDNTSGCTKQACGFRDNYPAIEAHNAVILGVSPDSVTSHQSFKAEYDLPFTLLVDQDHAIAELYGVWGEKSMYGRKYMGILRSQFVIDEEGKIIDARVNVKPTDSPRLALQALGDG
jgi:peroxiredoxin Q/BCP